jgi:hypothetical protein
MCLQEWEGMMMKIPIRGCKGEELDDELESVRVCPLRLTCQRYLQKDVKVLDLPYNFNSQECGLYIEETKKQKDE